MQLFDDIIVDNGIYKLWITWTVYKDWFLQRRRAYNACQIPPHLGYLNDLCVSCIYKSLKLYIWVSGASVYASYTVWVDNFEYPILLETLSTSLDDPK